MLLNYLSLSAGNTESQLLDLSCLETWIRSGDIKLEMIQDTPIVPFAFESLQKPEMFDICVDIICEIINQSSQPVNESVISLLFPKILNLHDLMLKNSEDPDFIRGICRISAEAGEGYVSLIISNLEAFQVILQMILYCTSYEDLDIAKYTFNFWGVFADHIGQLADQNAKKTFMPIFQRLLETMMKQLRYPDDLDSLSAKERDEFKDFRYIIGDVVKDCIRVIGDDGVSVPFNVLLSFFISEPNSSQPSLDPQVTWQQIEAPLFTIRLLCKEISLTESKYIPEIMGMLSRFPENPKIRYASTLFIGRYAEWTNMHPEMLSYQLQYVSQGFESTDDVHSAASIAFRDLCRFCSNVNGN